MFPSKESDSREQTQLPYLQEPVPIHFRLILQLQLLKAHQNEALVQVYILLTSLCRG